MGSTVTVSLEPHLARALNPLLAILSPELCTVLAAELELTEIHYSVLSQISRWARTDAGQGRLRAAQLNPRDYDNMVSLLAGTRTSPSSKLLPGVLGSESSEACVKRELNDRKALIAVLNGLLSVSCIGGAVWWAADKSGWRDEWKVLSALMVATIVGVSETILFVIWQSRISSPSLNQRRRSSKLALSSDKKSDDNGAKVEPTRIDASLEIEDADHRLRHRTPQAIGE